MKKLMIIATTLLALAAMAVSLHLYRNASQLERLIAVSWGDGQYGKALYGAYVFYEEQDGRLLVKLSVRIDRGTVWSRYAHDTRQIGSARDVAEAVEKWGVIAWTDKGLVVGRSPESAYLFPRHELESHR